MVLSTLCQQQSSQSCTDRVARSPTGAGVYVRNPAWAEHLREVFLSLVVSLAFVQSGGIAAVSLPNFSTLRNLLERSGFGKNSLVRDCFYSAVSLAAMHPADGRGLRPSCICSLSR